MPAPLLSDDKIALRAIEPTDFDTLFRWENDTTLWAVGSTIAPLSRKNLWEYIQNYTPDIYSQGQLRLMITLKDTGTPVGTLDMFDFDHFNRRACVGILIDSAYAKQGLGTRALNLANNYAGSFIGLHQLWAIIPIDNTASYKLFSKCGYKTCGKLQSWLRRGNSYCDAHIMQILL